MSSTDPGADEGTGVEREEDPSCSLDRARVAAPLAAGSTRVALGLAYDGAGFHGFARQPGQRTVAGTLADALARVVGHPVDLVCAGRTDTGVHALAQVVHVDLASSSLTGRYEPEDGDLSRLALALDRQLRPEIRAWRARVAPSGFDARRSALARRYRYDLDVAERPDPLRRGGSWRIDKPVDLARLRLATDPVLGVHDFAAFCRRPSDRPAGPLTRQVIEARWDVLHCGILRFQIEATAFCHQMVRSLVGAIVAAGTGRIRPSDMTGLLASARRDGAPSPAPACGLTLVAVRYPADLGGDWC